MRVSRKCDDVLHLPVVLDHHLTLSRLGGDWECEKGKSDQEHLDEDDATPELPIVENGKPGELVEADKLLASTSIPHLGAKASRLKNNKMEPPKMHLKLGKLYQESLGFSLSPSFQLTSPNVSKCVHFLQWQSG